jgi:hypothetical protein
LIDRLDYLIDLSNETMYEFGLKVAKKEAESMLEKEKEMIFKAYGNGYEAGFTSEYCVPEQYYNETFNTNEK